MNDIEKQLQNISLDQSGINDLFDSGIPTEKPKHGIQALLGSSSINYERLPMLEIIFDRFCRRFTVSLRSLLNDNVEITISSIETKRFQQYLDTINLPCMIYVFKAQEWDNYAICDIDSHLVYSIVDVMLGGRQGNSPMRIEGRNYTTLEKTLVKKMFETLLGDLTSSFLPVSNITFIPDRLETNPRFCMIARSPNAVVVIKLAIYIGERSGMLTIMFPYATLEPIREKLLQQYMGEKFGQDTIWERHLSDSLLDTNVELVGYLGSNSSKLMDVMKWTVGSTVKLSTRPGDPVELKCGEKTMFAGKLGKSREHIAVSINEIKKLSR
jgi:flagellar motor switch protein FliM